MFLQKIKPCLMACVLSVIAMTLSAQSDTAQQSLQLTYDEALNLMLKENLTIVASHYDVKVAEGELYQARMWSNPHFNWNSDMYSVERNEYFNYKNQRLIQVDQVFSIAGKHTRTVKLNKINVEINKLMFEDVKRSLIYELGIQYNSLLALQQKETIYTYVISRFKSLIDAFEVQYKVGAIPGSELVRLKSEMIALQNDVIQNQNELNNTMSKLRVMLNLKHDVYVKTIESKIVVPENISIADLIAKAENSRPDFLLRKKGVEYQDMNVKLQKSIAVPDVLVGYQPHDKGSNYVRPYSGVVVEFDLPLFNRNQGKIKIAQAQLQKAEVLEEQQSNKLENEIASSLFKLLNTRTVLENYNESFLEKLESLNESALKNFNKKNISILEYIDIQRTYLLTMTEFIDLKTQNVQNVNHLQFTTGTTLF